MTRILKNNLKFKKKLYFLNSINYFEKNNSINKITIIILSKNTLHYEELLMNYALLCLLIKHKPKFIRAKKSINKYKSRKGFPIGVKITLRNLIKDQFFIRLIWEIIPKTTSFLITSKIESPNKSLSVLNFCIKNPFVFQELQPFFFFFKENKNIQISISFEKNTKKQYFLYFCRLLKLPFHTDY